MDIYRDKENSKKVLNMIKLEYGIYMQKLNREIHRAEIPFMNSNKKIWM